MGTFIIWLCVLLPVAALSIALVCVAFDPDNISNIIESIIDNHHERKLKKLELKENKKMVKTLNEFYNELKKRIDVEYYDDIECGVRVEYKTIDADDLEEVYKKMIGEI